MKIIECFIAVFLLIFLMQSCSNKTSMLYEMGKEFKKMKAEFIKGITPE